MDTMLDLAVRDHLETVFMNDNVSSLQRRRERAPCRNSPTTKMSCSVVLMPAHTSTSCRMSHCPAGLWPFGYGSRVSSLEEVVHGFTGRLAEVFGLDGRGVLAPGKAADICIFDVRDIGASMPLHGQRPARKERTIRDRANRHLPDDRQRRGRHRGGRGNRRSARSGALTAPTRRRRCSQRQRPVVDLRAWARLGQRLLRPDRRIVNS